MLKKIIFLFLFVGFATLGFAQKSSIILQADGYTEGVGVIKDENYFSNGIKLYGLYFPGYAIYEFPLDIEQQSVGLELLFENPRSQQMDVFVWNYGTRKVDPNLRKENLQPDWLLWESTSKQGNWESSRPKFLVLREGDGIIDFLGNEGVLKILLYADGGTPPTSDELFFIDKLILKFSPYREIFQRISQMDSVWVEDNFILAKGVGFSAQMPDTVNAAMKRASAKRAATVDAYRKLAKAIYGSQIVEGKEMVAGEIKGASEKEMKAIENEGIEVILQMPIDKIELE
jgi:hypothetical protein